MNALRALGSAALDLLAPPTCPGCDAGLFFSSHLGQANERTFCATCELAIAPRDPAGCAGCDRASQRGGLCRRCLRLLAPLKSVEATFDYEGPIAAALQGLKYQGRDDRLRPLVRRWFMERSATSLAPRDILPRPLIVPVPLHPRRLATRGFDQAWLLAREVARSIGAEARPRALHRVRATPPQVGLGRAAREANVRGAFEAEPLVARRDILLVDDVTTTGSTLRACAEALVEAGARSVRALVVARAQP